MFKELFLTENKKKKRRMLSDPMDILRRHKIKIKSFKPTKETYEFETYEDIDLKVLRNFKVDKLKDCYYSININTL